MIDRPLGNTGMTVSLLGLGTVKLGRNTEVRYPERFAIPDERSARDLLNAAGALGINLLDTAPAYGTSEARLGQLLADPQVAYGRKHWLLASKVGEEFEAGRSTFDFSAEHTRASVLRSLARLGTDYLDIVLIHSDGNDLEILEHHGTLQVLQELKTEGLVRAVGISHKTVAGAERAITLGADVLMATLNANQRDEEDLVAAAGRAGCGVLIKKALQGGHGAAEQLRYVAAQPGVSCVVVGSINPAHLRENAAILDALDR